MKSPYLNEKSSDFDLELDDQIWKFLKLVMANGRHFDECFWQQNSMAIEVT